MKFPLHQLYGLNKSKPMVEVEGVEGELQWDECDLTGLPPVSYTHLTLPTKA